MDKLTPQQILELKVDACADLLRDGKISRGECFKHEVALSIGEDAGPIITIPAPAVP